MNVVDSCGWIEYFTDGPNARFFAAPLDDVDKLLIPAITVFEVYKYVLTRLGEEAAQAAVSQMGHGMMLDLDARGAIAAAIVSDTEGLAMADAIVLSEARRVGATLWTQDADFEGMDGVRYVAAV